MPTAMHDARQRRRLKGRRGIQPRRSGGSRGGSLLFPDSEEKSVPDWNAERCHEFNSRNQMPASRGRGQRCNINSSEVRICLSTVQTLSTIILSPNSAR